MPWGAVAGAVAGEVLSSAFSDDPSADTAQHSTLTPEQNAKLKELLASQKVGANATDPYTGKLTADLSPLERTSLSGLEQYAQTLVNPTVNDALMKIISGDQTGFEDYFQKSIEDPLLQDFNQKILPSLTKRFGGSGAFSSDRNAAERNATNDLTKNLAASKSSLAFQTTESAKNRQLGGIQALQQQGPALLGALQGGGVERGVAQSDLNAKYLEFQRQQGGSQQNINNILSALGLKGVENITTVDPGRPDFLTSAAPGIGYAAASKFLTPAKTGGSSGTVNIPSGM